MENNDLKERNINDIISMANEGNVDAINELGVRYISGEGVEKDEKKAFELFNSASEKNCIKAKFNLAMCYYNGGGIAQNKALAFNMFRELVDEHQYDDAYYYLGECYYLGRATQIDYKKAFEYFNEALKYGKNIYASKYYIGESYMWGRGD